MQLPLHITEQALGEINKIMERKKIPQGYGLRIGVKSTGCLGVSYMLGFDHKKDNDDEFDLNGLQIYIGKKDMMHLVGMELDYYSGSDAQGFQFSKN